MSHGERCCKTYKLSNQPRGDSLLVFVNEDGLEILSLIHLIAIEAAHVVDPVAACNHLSPFVLARTFHNPNHPYFKDLVTVVKAHLRQMGLAVYNQWFQLSGG